ncbi:glycosyltransferase [Pedobacter montanisoli]|uniref:Glycosyltransferase n=1 Tax=Pedobacter montanisoli TaxID=2923277 RepID=A0ABS9ZVV3_9SPHI|nr:glycosyltransferase [Pedobacter montanisoli]MCJ0742441.1 glycosyltransferase [Pedobacter montanisoli]
MDRVRKSRFSPYLTDLQSIGFFLPTLPQRIKKVIHEFEPDMVISLMQLITFYYPAYHYARQKHIPFVLFCHDDAEDFAKPHKFFKEHLTRLNAKIYQSAKKRVCISPEMTKSWEEKYKAKSDFLYPVSSKNIKAKAVEKVKTLVNNNYLTIGYAGSLAYGYKEGINEIIPVLEKTNSKLKIYRNNDPGIINSSVIEFAGFAETPEQTWNRITEECDVVILPYSKEKKFEDLYRTHFPSKLPEYLGLQMPVIINGPSYANGLRYGKTNNIFFNTTTNTELEDALKKLAANAELRIKSIETSNKTYDFDPKLIIKKFYSIIYKALQ